MTCLLRIPTDYRKTGAEIIGISTDPVDKLQAFKAKHKLTYPLLSDSDASVIKAYDSALSLPFLGTFANRNTYIIDPEGNLREAYAKVSAICFPSASFPSPLTVSSLGRWTPKWTRSLRSPA